MSGDAVQPGARMETAGSDGSDVLVEVRNLKTYYGGDGLFSGKPVRAVDDVTFDIKRGETLGLVGESGCGKTTLGRTLIQLEKATAGEIRFDGTDITTLRGYELKEWRRNAQMVFQDPDSSLNDRMTVGEIVREPLDVHDWKTPRERRQRVRDLLDTVGLPREHYYRYPHQFSGGQLQRIGIARTLSLEPEFIVLDEPVSALDVSVQAEVINLLEDLQEEFGLTYLFIAHDLSVVRHICDRVAVMYLGNIMEIGPTEELFDDPSNPYTYSLLSAIPEPDPTVKKERITLQGTPPSPRYPPDGCPFSTRCPVKIRPDDVPDMDEETWDDIEMFWGVVRERHRADRSLREIAKSWLGIETRFSSVDEIVAEVFGVPSDLPDDADPRRTREAAMSNLPDSVREVIETAIDRIQDNDEQGALDVLRENLGSVCDGRDPDRPDEDIGRPDHHRVSESGRLSLCHRHRSEYAEPDDQFGDIFGD
jgi:peptide/nickel transport system ATP-binding protein